MRLFGFDIELVDTEKEGTNRGILADMDNSQLSQFLATHCCPPGILFTEHCSESECAKCWEEWLSAERGGSRD